MPTVAGVIGAQHVEPPLHVAIAGDLDQHQQLNRGQSGGIEYPRRRLFDAETSYWNTAMDSLKLVERAQRRTKRVHSQMASVAEDLQDLQDVITQHIGTCPGDISAIISNLKSSSDVIRSSLEEQSADLHVCQNAISAFTTALADAPLGKADAEKLGRWLRDTDGIVTDASAVITSTLDAHHGITGQIASLKDKVFHASKSFDHLIGLLKSRISSAGNLATTDDVSEMISVALNRENIEERIQDAISAKVKEMAEMNKAISGVVGGIPAKEGGADSVSVHGRNRFWMAQTAGAVSAQSSIMGQFLRSDAGISAPPSLTGLPQQISQTPLIFPPHPDDAPDAPEVAAPYPRPDGPAVNTTDIFSKCPFRTDISASATVSPHASPLRTERAPSATFSPPASPKADISVGDPVPNSTPSQDVPPDRETEKRIADGIRSENATCGSSWMAIRSD